jgi:MFS superfamily sulfate permease-like transporter
VIEKLINSAVSGVIGGLTSAVFSVVMAAFTVPMPIDKTHHVVGYGISGFICGLLSAFMGVFMHMQRTEKAQLRSSGSERNG